MPENKTPLTDAQVDQQLAALAGWRREGKYLRKDFVFANYKEINAFLPYLTKTIVTQNHHPDFSFVAGKKLVAVETSTHATGGLTQADLDLARALDGWRSALG